MKRKHIALMLFGGNGSRFGGDLPKQFVKLDGFPLLVITLRKAASFSCIDEIYVVAKKGTVMQTKEMILSYQIPKVKAVIEGGESRALSSWKGLSYLKLLPLENKDIVAICDGDRPNLDEAIFMENFAAAEKSGACVTAISSTDSTFSSREGEQIDKYLPRKTIYAAQTPQTFAFGKIYEAYAKRKTKLEQYTDDASLYLSINGNKVAIVEGSKENIKITTKEDASIFLLLQRREK